MSQSDKEFTPCSDADIDWMHRALALAARAGDKGEVPVGAVLVDANGVLVGEGFNQPISGCDPSAHAEIVALRDAAKKAGNYRLVGTTMYVTIEPCTMCIGALIHARVSRLVFGSREPKAGAVISNLQLLDSEIFNHDITVTEGVCAELASRLMRDFFRGRRADKKLNRE